MGYTAIQVPFRKARFRIPTENSTTVPFVNNAEDLRDLPQLMNPQQALRIVNYVVTADSGLERRKGLSLLLDDSGTDPVTMVQKFTSDLYFYAYKDKIRAYSKSTGTKTTIHTYSVSGTYSGQRYGDYFFITNGLESIGRISQTLNYDAQTVNFTTGKVVTGQTSGATATILQDADAGATGTLTLGSIVGIFQDNELIIDSAGGSATANGAVGFTYTTVSGSPICKVLKVIGPRLYAGNLSTDATAVAYSDEDTGANPPFSTWATGTNATDPGLLNYRNAGAVNAIEGLGPNIVVFAANGKWAFTTTTISNNNLLTKVDQVVFQRIDMGGSRATIVTPGGLFYVNNGALWQIVSIGQPNVPFSEQEHSATQILGIKFFESLNLDNADFSYDPKQDTIYLTCARDSSKNNFVLAFNVSKGTFSEFTGWNINRFMIDNQTIYGAGSFETKVWRCFDGYSDDGKDVWYEYYQELKTGDLETRQVLLGEYVDAFLSPSTRILVSFDIYDVKGVFQKNKIQFQLTLKNEAGSASGYGQSSYGLSGYGTGQNDSGAMVEYFDGARGFIRNYQRLRIHLTGHDQLPHRWVWFKVIARSKVPIRRRHLTQIT